MVFRRRDRRGLGRAVWEGLYPKGGWSRAYLYVKHRVKRLPGTPEEIARGIAVGVFVSISPFYGLHFVLAAFLAIFLRANILAALLGTFFGNPLTYIPIGVATLSVGNAMLGSQMQGHVQSGFGLMFSQAIKELWNNLITLFTSSVGDWTYLAEFWKTVFWPWLVGGVPLGIVAGFMAYYLSVPTIRAYKNRRKGRLAAKLIEIRKKHSLNKKS